MGDVSDLAAVLILGTYRQQGTVNYWTASAPFTFGSPAQIAETISVSLRALQQGIDGSAQLSLVGIDVRDANGTFLGSVNYTTDSGTLYTIAEVPEPWTGAMLPLAGTALWALRKRQRHSRLQLEASLY